MEVTASNFNEVLPEIENSIKECTFLSIDCELTGISTVSNVVKAFDTPKQYYESALKNCRQFLVIQYGLTLFQYDDKRNIFKHHSYNFYIFRKPIRKYIADQRFLCQSSSIDFLVTNNFDFNKFFKEGISYLNDTEENVWKETLAEFHKKKLDGMNSSYNENNDTVPVPDEAQPFINDVIQKLEDFLETDDKELQLPKCNAFYRRLIYQAYPEKFRGKLLVETRVIQKERFMFAIKLNGDQEKIQKEKYEAELKELDEYIAFSKVVRAIIDSGKLVIGHNLVLDFLHTIDKFLTPLPDDYQNFKECASSLFSKVLDTKFMSSSEPFKSLVTSTVLKQLLDTLLEDPFGFPNFEVSEGKQGYSIKDEKQHEAGYDSFITGLCALGMWKYLGSSRGWSEEDTFGKLGIRLLDLYLNKIFLMILADNQYLNLTGDDLNPSRDHVFYLTFPKEWKTDNIARLFSPFGSVQVSWLTDTSAYVGLFRKDQAALALSTLSQSDIYSITTYVRHEAELCGQKTPMSSPLKRRKSFEPPPKRRKTNSFDGASFSSSKRSIDPIEEEKDDSKSDVESESSVPFKVTSWNNNSTGNSSSENNSILQTPLPKKKTFAECDTWG